MAFRVINIQEDDFGCEDRPDDWEPQVIVTLEADDGSRTWRRVRDSALRAGSIDVGSEWPFDE